MGKYEKLLQTVLSGRSDANVKLDELRRLLTRLGFEERIRGSHHIFRKPGIEEQPNLQITGGKAKPYQVKQVREIIISHKLSE